MGSIISTLTSPRNPLIKNSDGNDIDYRNAYIVGPMLGRGQFGTVRELHPIMNHSDEKIKEEKKSSYAVKELHKGITIRDNVVYTPLRPDVLKGECHILRTLEGKNYALKLEAVYESPNMIYFVTEKCNGGDLLHWAKKGRKENSHQNDAKNRLLEIYDISRVAYQLLKAVDHCANHKIIHRDIKPENIIFQNESMDSDLRLIDFGSSAINRDMIDDSQIKTNIQQSQDDPIGHERENHIPDINQMAKEFLHNTMAGTPFYTSPEMFQRKYSYETDVWSIGVVLYVLIAGYPEDQLQDAFNILQNSKHQDLQRLPNLTSDIPSTYFDLLNGLLTYKRLNRPKASYFLAQDKFILEYNTQNDDT